MNCQMCGRHSLDGPCENCLKGCPEHGLEAIETEPILMRKRCAVCKTEETEWPKERIDNE